MITLLLLATVCDAKDYVFSVAFGYAESVVEPFLVSLRWSGFDGEIWLAVRNTETYLLRNISDSYATTLIGIEPSSKKIVLERFDWFVDWLGDLEWNDRVLITDLRDVFFQANPFFYHYATENGYVHLFAENNTIGNCRFNRWWIEKCYGSETLATLSDKLIVNAGTILGSAAAVENLIRSIIMTLNLNANCEEDQGTLNYIYYTELHRQGVILNRQGIGAANTLGYVKESDLRFGRNSLFVLNDDGARSALVHQYDRHPVLQDHYMRLVPFMKYILQRNKDSSE